MKIISALLSALVLSSCTYAPSKYTHIDKSVSYGRENVEPEPEPYYRPPVRTYYTPRYYTPSYSNVYGTAGSVGGGYYSTSPIR